MRLKTSSPEKRKQPSRLRSCGLRRCGRKFAEIVEDARFGIEFLVLILREVIGLDFVAKLVFPGGERLVRRPAA